MFNAENSFLTLKFSTLTTTTTKVLQKEILDHVFIFTVIWIIITHSIYSNLTRSFRYQHTFTEGFVCSFYEITECKERDRERHRRIEQKTEQKEKK